MCILFIEQLQVITTIGIYDWEQTSRQKLIFDIEIKNEAPLFEKQNNEYYLNYADISKAIVNYVEKKKFLLIEHVAEEVAQLLLNNFDFLWVRIKVSKPNALALAKNVGIIIKRGKI